jgi:hypothetical protein
MYYPRSVAATFDPAIAEAASGCPAAEALMAYLAHCAPEPIPLALAAGAIDGEAEANAALLALSEVSLVKSDPFADGTPAVAVHRLVQSAALRRAETNGLAADASARLLTRRAAIYPAEPDRSSETQSLCAYLGPHVTGGRLEQYRHTLSWARLEKRIEFYSTFCIQSSAWSWAIAQGAIDGAELYADRSRLLRAAEWPVHPDAAAELEMLAAQSEAKGDLAAARTMRERVLAIREALLRTEHRAGHRPEAREAASRSDRTDRG